MKTNENKLFIIREVDDFLSTDSSNVFGVEFVYNFFQKSERENVIDKYSKSLDGIPLLSIPRYVRINFKRHDNKYGLDAFSYSDVVDKITNSSLEEITESAKNESKISSKDMFNVNLNISDSFTNISKTFLQSSSSYTATKTESFLKAKINENLKEKYRSIIISTLNGDSDSYVNTIIQENDFNQPVEYTQYISSKTAAYAAVFNKLNNIKINSRITTDYLVPVLDYLANDTTQPHSTDMTVLRDAVVSMQSSGTDIIEDTTLDYFYYRNRVDKRPTSIGVIGYIIDKYEKFNDEKTQHPSIYIDGNNSNDASFIDRNVKYGGSYEYIIKTVIGVSHDGTISLEGSTEFDARLLKIFVSNGTKAKSVFCSENTTPKPPIDLNFQYDFNADALLINWSFPFNKQQDIKRFQIYRRSSFDMPFELIREYDFDDSTVTDSFSPSSGNVNNIRKLTTPLCNYYDPAFNEESKFIYAIAAVDARGITSGYSDQFVVTYDRFLNKTIAIFVSKEGAPKPYPNIFLETDSFPDAIAANSPKKINVYFNPECQTIKNASEILQDNFIVKDFGNYKINLINTDTQEHASINFSTIEEEFITEEERIRLKYGSYESGV